MFNYFWLLFLDVQLLAVNIQINVVLLLLKPNNICIALNQVVNSVILMAVGKTHPILFAAVYSTSFIFLLFKWKKKNDLYAIEELFQSGWNCEDGSVIGFDGCIFPKVLTTSKNLFATQKKF